MNCKDVGCISMFEAIVKPHTANETTKAKEQVEVGRTTTVMFQQERKFPDIQDTMKPYTRRVLLFRQAR